VIFFSQNVKKNVIMFCSGDGLPLQNDIVSIFKANENRFHFIKISNNVL